MINKLDMNKALFIVTGLLALVAAVIGVVDPGIYEPVVSDEIVPGVFTQDLVVIIAAVLLIVLAAWMKRDDFRKMIVVFGILGFFFYAFGIYVIEQIYTALYILYLGVLSLSFFGLVLGLSSLRQSEIEGLKLTPIIRYSSAGYGVLIAVMFNFIWINQLIPLMQTGYRIEYMFSVFIIDLVFIMPAFVIAGIFAIRRRAIGMIGLPALFVLGVGILSPLALAEILKPYRYDLPMDTGEFWLYAVLSLVFLGLTGVYLLALRRPRAADR